ncbi:MAG: ABC transporter ATP-binding protein [Nocardioidaceae bacterium]
MPDTQPANADTDTDTGDGSQPHRGVPIILTGLTKRYPNQPKAAVDSVDMEIPAGEIVVFVGPSGCGKTTTMRMINRLIEPTSGTITIGGEDVTKLDDVQLRRKIGYVIQQIGLIPHLTIAANVALVPKLLKWDKKRIARRVDEMLTVVGLDPDDYRSRYPRQLSGGQQQRVGVARALAADPPIMLMDEPFGAVDPITRSRLQDEFLSLQRTLRKTIVFVTHDFDEALKIGDRIAVLREGSQIAQYDTPENILAAPADEFVEGFIGEGAALKRLHFERVDSLELDHDSAASRSHETVDVSSTLHSALDLMVGKGLRSVTVARDGRPVGAVSVERILSRVHPVGDESGDTDTVGA